MNGRSACRPRPRRGLGEETIAWMGEGEGEGEGMSFVFCCLCGGEGDDGEGGVWLSGE